MPAYTFILFKAQTCPPQPSSLPKRSFIPEPQLSSIPPKRLNFCPSHNLNFYRISTLIHPLSFIYPQTSTFTPSLPKHSTFIPPITSTFIQSKPSFIPYPLFTSKPQLSSHPNSKPSLTLISHPSITPNFYPTETPRILILKNKKNVDTVLFSYVTHQIIPSKQGQMTGT